MFRRSFAWCFPVSSAENHVLLLLFMWNTWKCTVKTQFKTRAGLKSHVYRHHKRYKSEMCTTSLECHVDLCGASIFISQSKIPIKEGRKVTCSFIQCGKTFAVISTIISHLSRKQRRPKTIHRYTWSRLQW